MELSNAKTYKSDPDTLFSGLGVTFPRKRMSIETILSKAGLDWEAIVEKPKYGSKVGRQVEARCRSIVYRSDTLQDLTYCSNDWKPYQNKRFIGDFKDFCDRNDLYIERVGFIPARDDQFKGGNVVFSSALVPEHLNGIFAIGNPEDVTIMRIVAYNHHEYGRGSGFILMSERLACTNGMTLARKGSSEVMKHISSQTGEQYVSNLLENLKGDIAEYRDNLESFSKIPLTDTEAMDLYVELIGDRSKPFKQQDQTVQTCYSILMGEAGQSQHASKTYYGVLQSITAYKTHFSGENMSSSSHLQSRLQGTSAKFVSNFYNKLLNKAKDRESKSQLLLAGIYIN